MKLKESLILAGVCFFTSQSFGAGAGASGPRDVLSVGCHMYDPTCYAELSGDNFTNCPTVSNQVRWSKNEVNGKEFLAMFLQAKSNGSKVDLEIGGCSGQGYPTFQWGTMR